MKKFLGILLALSMIFTALPGFAYSDISNREDITILSDLGIIDGFEDNTFRANEDLTRAQLVKVICSLLGYTNLSTCDTSFTDVDSSHWASGYISFAYSKGIIIGFEDGTFRPEEKVSYEQAVKMVVCVLGYEPAAIALGSGKWYNGYLNIASSIGVTKNVDGYVGMNFTRGAMAKLLYNALSTQMMDMSSWGTNGVKYEKSEDTIMSKYLEIEKWEGIVANTPYMSYMSGNDKAVLTLEKNATLYLYNGKTKTDNFKAAVCDKYVEDLLGKKVVCYVGEDDKGEWKVFSIAEKDNYNSSLVIKAVDVETDNDGNVFYDNGNKMVKVKLADSVKYIRNYEELTGIWEPQTANGNVIFVDNDRDNYYDYVIDFNYNRIGSVVSDIENYDGIISFDAEGIDEYDPDDENVRIVVARDGKIAQVSDIQINDTITVIGDDDSNFKIYLVSSKTVSGLVKGINKNENTVTIGNQEYGYSIDPTVNLVFNLNDNITAYFNIDDEIIFIDTDNIAINKYGMILRYYEDTNEEIAKIEVVFSNGSRGIYEIADNKKAEIATEIGFTGRLKYANLVDSLYQITLRNKDNKITKVRSVDYDADAIAIGKTYDEETMTFGPIDIDNSTILFSVEQTQDGYVRAEDVAIGQATDFFTDDEGEDFVLYPYINRNEVYNILIGTGITGTISNKSDVVVVESVSTTVIDSEDDTGYQVIGMRGGKKVEYMLYDCEQPSEGDIILLGTKSNGVYKKYTVLATAETVQTTTDDVTTGKIRELFGKVDRKNTTSTRLYIENGSDVLMKSSANYILIDCTGSRLKVEKKTKGINIFGSEKYNSYVYVRYYDDVQSEVIVYRFN